MTMKLSTALVATLPRHQIRALVDASAISKSDLAAINAIRAGGDGETAKRRVFGAIRKQYEEADERLQPLKRAIEIYAKQRVEQTTREREDNMSTIEKMLGMSEEV